VFIDQTARLDISMEPEAIEVNAMIVVGDRLTIKKDVATSVASVSSEEVSSLPISNVMGAVDQHSGTSKRLCHSENARFTCWISPEACRSPGLDYFASRFFLITCCLLPDCSID
jgi:hypothetical protein